VKIFTGMKLQLRRPPRSPATVICYLFFVDHWRVLLDDGRTTELSERELVRTYEEAKS